MTERLLAAATRIEDAIGRCDSAGSPLRPEQVPVLSKFEDFLLDLATGPVVADGPILTRIVLPPRTGKTVLAAHIIRRTELTATFIVPTKTLVRQVAEEMRAQLPGVRIGVYFGEDKRIVEHGVNVTTYAILQRQDWKLGGLPRPLRRAGLVFADEAHHAMTESRMALLNGAFLRGAICIALTATPNYGAERRLSQHFPELIYELSLYEALKLGLLAPLRVWAAEVDSRGSTVRMVAGDYDAETLGRLMSAAPFFRAVEVFRWDGDNATMPALICCASRQQAYDLYRYLQQHRPAGAAEPQIVLGETGDRQRREILERFERGDLDTIIQVGVLIEGWSSRRCKLLVDLAPSRSRVRATQKFFRVMTRDGDREARIFVLLPTGLPELPILPTDLVGDPYADYECGTLLGGSDGAPNSRKQLEQHERTAVSAVRLRKRILACFRFEQPRFSRDDRAQLREVLRSCEALFDARRPFSMYRFRQLRFHHALFAGNGAFLLEHIGVSDKDSFVAWLTGLFPEQAADALLEADRSLPRERSCEDDLRRLLEGPASRGSRSRSWAALGGRLLGLAPSAEDELIERQEIAAARGVLELVEPRERRILEWRLGFGPEGPLTLREIADRENISSGRIGQIEAKALRRLRHPSRRRPLEDLEFPASERRNGGPPIPLW